MNKDKSIIYKQDSTFFKVKLSIRFQNFTSRWSRFHIACILVFSPSSLKISFSTTFRYSMQIWNIQSPAWFPVSPTQYVWQHSLLLEREAVVEWLLRHQKCHKRQSFPHCHSSIMLWSIQLSFYHADMLATPNQV